MGKRKMTVLLLMFSRCLLTLSVQWLFLRVPEFHSHLFFIHRICSLGSMLFLACLSFYRSILLLTCRVFNNLCSFCAILIKFAPHINN